MMISRAAALVLFGALALSANAQWQWLDSGGRKVFSDRPPTQEIPEKNILKRPAVSAHTATTSATPAGSAMPPKPSGKDPELEKKKAQAETAEAAKKQAEEQKNASIKAENCERAKRAQAALQSGVRIAQVNAQGEREFMSDETREAETQRTQSIVASNCQ